MRSPESPAPDASRRICGRSACGSSPPIIFPIIIASAGGTSRWWPGPRGASPAEVLVTTEKDLARIAAPFPPGTPPLYALSQRLLPADPHGLLGFVLDRLA